MQHAQEAAAPRRGHAFKNQRYANDGSYESVQNLLKQIAGRCWARIEKMGGLGMEFDDVHQEMVVAYAKAKAKWDPARGVLFSTYCQTVCIRNFNELIAKAERERAQLGMVSIEEFTADSSEEFGHTNDPLEFLTAGGDADLSIEDQFIEAEEAAQRRLDMHAKLSSMSPNTKRFLLLLLQSQKAGPGDFPRLSEIARTAGLDGTELKAVKEEIFRHYRVRWMTK